MKNGIYEAAFLQMFPPALADTLDRRGRDVYAMLQREARECDRARLAVVDAARDAERLFRTLAEKVSLGSVPTGPQGASVVYDAGAFVAELQAKRTSFWAGVHA